ncbi:hypothetical protein Tco_1245639 [Tanacetum coccineum]
MTEGFLNLAGELQVEMQEGIVHDHAVMIGGAIGLLYLEGESWELRLQLAEERHAWLELAEIVNNMRRGQEPQGDV